ncbi:Thiol-disulfide oxidoreductase ResA [archaeon HR01]|nr:Thiol-disulfide oxidoreductase ResA [archaeon HR01]
MKKHRVRSKARYAAAIPAILVVALVAFLTLSPPQRVEVSGPRKAPDFTLEILDVDGLAGRSLSLSSLNGRPVLMDFVFEWCPHCNNMAPIVERLHQKFGDKVFFLTVFGS